MSEWISVVDRVPDGHHGQQVEVRVEGGAEEPMVLQDGWWDKPEWRRVTHWREPSEG